MIDISRAKKPEREVHLSHKVEDVPQERSADLLTYIKESGVKSTKLKSEGEHRGQGRVKPVGFEQRPTGVISWVLTMRYLHSKVQRKTSKTKKDHS